MATTPNTPTEIATPAASPAAPAAAKPSAKKAAVKKVAAKPSAKQAAKPVAKPVAKPEAKPVKASKPKLVRDSFTMPSADFDLIDHLKERALGFKRPAKKSELLRAGLQVLVTLSDAKLKAALEALTPLKAGRPKNSAR